MAKSTIGSMVAVVSATAGQFEADLKKAGASVDRFKAHTNTAGNALSKGGFAQFFSGGLSAGAGFALAKQGLDALIGGIKSAAHEMLALVDRMDDLADFAEQIGSTANELSGLRFAADIMGSSAESMDKALTKLLVNIGKARANPLGAQAKAFKRIGLEANQLSLLGAGDQIKALADGLKTLPSLSDRAATGVVLLGKDSVTLARAMGDGSEAIAALIKEHEQLHGMMDPAAFEQFKDAIVRQAAAWEGLKIRLATGTLPTLTKVLELITKITADTKSLDQAIGFVVPGFAEWRAFLNRGLGEDADWFAAGKVLRAQLEAQIKKEAQEAADAAERAQEKLEKLFEEGEKLTAKVRTPFEEFNDTIRDLANLLDVGAINWQTYTRAIEEAKDTLDKATKSKEKLDAFRQTPGVAAVEGGTTAGFSAVQSAARAQVDLQRRDAAVQQQQLAEMKRQTDIQKIIEKNGRGRILNGVEF